MDLNGKVAVVTGGSGGLGGRICLALANAGSRVAVLYNLGRDAAGEMASQLEGLGVEAKAFQCDVTDPQRVESVVTQVVEHFGRLDILINDAAYNKWIPFDDLDALTHEAWSKILDVNLTGPMLFTKAVAAPMKKQGAGRVVNISSNAGLAPRGSSIAYAVSKAGLIHLTRCMAVALAPEVLVNCVAPGFIEGTRMSQNLSEEYQRSVKKNSLLKRAADKDDVAALVVALCATTSITGQSVVIDSGVLFH